MDLKITRQEWEVTAERGAGDEWDDVRGLTPERITAHFTSMPGADTHPEGITVTDKDGWFDNYSAAAALAHAGPWLVSVIAAARDRIAEED